MIWLIGNKGMLGTEVEILLKQNKISCVCSDKEVDITDRRALDEFVQGKPVTCIINCSAYTAVDKAETDYAMAFKINHYGVMNICGIAAKRDVPLIHVSTDYVFDGNASKPYTEEDSINPAGIYAKSKAAGEQEILSACKKYFIVRTAWLYGRHGNNFVHTMLRLFRERDSVNVVNDQYGSPTYAKDLAAFLLLLTERTKYGIYHFTGQGVTTWHRFAVEIYEKAKSRGLLSKECIINPVTTDQFPVKAARPKYSVLSKEKAERELGYHIPGWEEALLRFMDELKMA